MSQNLTDTEISLVRRLQKEYDETAVQLGQVCAQLALLEDSKAKLSKQLVDLHEEERSTAQQLKEKYGEGAIDIKTGVFTPAQ